MFKRFSALILFAAIAFMSIGGTALAAEATVTATAGTGATCDNITVSGSGFAANSTQTIRFQRGDDFSTATASAATNSSGSFSASFSMTALFPGKNVNTGYGVQVGNVIANAVTISGCAITTPTPAPTKAPPVDTTPAPTQSTQPSATTAPTAKPVAVVSLPSTSTTTTDMSAFVIFVAAGLAAAAMLARKRLT